MNISNDGERERERKHVSKLLLMGTDRRKDSHDGLACSGTLSGDEAGQ